MEIFIGLLLAILGVPLFVAGISMFIKSDGWFPLIKAVLVIIVGSILSLVSLAFLGDGFGF